MMVIAASWPSNRLAAVTKRTGCTGTWSDPVVADDFGWLTEAPQPGWLLSSPDTRTSKNRTSMHPPSPARSEEHTSELQSRENLVCRLLLEKKKYAQICS